VERRAFFPSASLRRWHHHLHQLDTEHVGREGCTAWTKTTTENTERQELWVHEVAVLPLPNWDAFASVLLLLLLVAPEEAEREEQEEGTSIRLQEALGWAAAAAAS
tara:strand:- start:1204 stop:1521 length:318 start_codon:yes stop_codon:yes gene_type:complete